MTLIFKFDLDMATMFSGAQNEVSICRITDTHTDNTHTE